MRFDTYIPCNALKPHIQQFAIQETSAESSYKVLPGTSVVIGFQYSGKLMMMKDEQEIALSPSGLTGLHDRFRVFKNSAGIGTVLVYFKAGGARAFFPQPLHELFRESVSLDNFLLRSELLLLEEQLYESDTDARRIAVVERFLVSRISGIEPDPLVLAALDLIYKSRGQVRISGLIKALHTSQSPLEKRFRQAVGTTPKKFASIVRLKQVMNSYKPGTSMTELAYDAGFFDQAHFIREFKTFTGQTPEDFFRS